MLAHPATARFVTRGGHAYDARQSWAETAFLVGHWQLLGYGMFVVEERETGAFVGRVGALQPKGWPGFEIGWAVTPEARGKGYATEAAEAAIDWSFSSFELERIISIIHSRNVASQRVAEKLGEQPSNERFSPLGESCEVWEISRETWRARHTVRS
jgi:RimJ/RimL family protein N-acetyltransferase